MGSTAGEGGGGFRVGLEPLDDEVTAVLPVTGEVPSWLTGTLLRNGPGRWTAGRRGSGDRVRHWFDGLAMLHRFAFRDGSVHYANRYLRSRAYEHAERHGTVGFPEFATNPRRSLAERVSALRPPPVFGDNASVNVLRVGGRHVAVTETPVPVAVDPGTLETLGPVPFEDDLPGIVTTAHPQRDARRGALVNYTVEIGRRSAYHLHELADGSMRREALVTVPVDRPAYMHSFAMTEHHVVLVEYPYVAEPLALLAGRPFLDAYRWRPQRGTRFTVVERASGSVVRRVTTDPFFCFHSVGAVEDGGELVLDLLAMPGERALRQFLLDDLRRDVGRTTTGELRRYRVPLGDRPVSYRLLSTTALEFPRTAAAGAGEPYRVVYGVGTGGSLTAAFADRLVAVDLETGRTRTWSAPGCFPGEPVHVAPPGAAGGGDDGVVLSVVLDAAARRSSLLVLDARSFTEVARADVPHVVPLGFHGQYFPELTGSA